MGDSDCFTTLAAGLREWTAQRGLSPSAVQREGIGPVLAGDHSLLIAPTGSGKTLAAMLPLASRCLSEGWEALAVLYVTPLRALNRDVERRISVLGEAVGLSVDVRHGDTPQSRRTAQTRKPPHILITTPETFQIMFTGWRLRKMLSSVRAVVIDEIHEMARSERGWQLAVGLERLEQLTGSPVQRVGLSATVGNPAEVARWMHPDAAVYRGEDDRRTVLRVRCQPADDDDAARAAELGTTPSGLAALRLLGESIEQRSPALVFVNSRNTAETVCQRLATLHPELRLGVHHGSLARETRTAMEDDLRAERLDALICTSSLELGIDVGSIRRVVQLRSPRSVEHMLQRVGRTDHRIGGTGEGLVIAWEPDDLAESAVIACRAMAGVLEPISWRRAPLSVAANQLMMIAAVEKVASIDEASEMFSGVSQFTGWDRDDTIAVLELLKERYLLDFQERPLDHSWTDWPWATYELVRSHAAKNGEQLPEQVPMSLDELPEWVGDVPNPPLAKRFHNGWFCPTGRGKRHTRSNPSMIPDRRSYRVRDIVTRRLIGSVDEAFVLSLDDIGREEGGRSRVFVMAGRPWMVIDADAERELLMVSPAKDTAEAPIWSGELPPTAAGIAREVGAMRITLLEEFSEQDPVPRPRDTFRVLHPDPVNLADYPLDDAAWDVLTSAVIEHHDASGCVPSDALLTIEQRRDAIVLNCCQGDRINETLGQLLLAMASTVSGRVGKLLVDPYRISLRTPQCEARDVVEWLTQTPPAALDGILRISLANSRAVRSRFVIIAKSLGLLAPGTDPWKVNISAMVRRYKGSLMMDEVIDKLLHERMDLEGATDVLASIEAGEIEVRITAPGPLGLSPKSERELLLPGFSSAETLARLEGRLLNERVALCCMNCGASRAFRAARYDQIDARCPSCGSFRSACAREGMRAELERWVGGGEAKASVRMERNAELLTRRGFDAVLALMARGVGEETAERVLRRAGEGDRQALLEAISEAEVQYARTRRFWG